MARKKIVLVIVEGPSDDTALGVVLNQVYDKNFVHIHIIHGDITTRAGVNPQNIVAKIGNDIRGYAKSQHYKASDFKQIIHIVDTDGAYISDERIIEEAGIGETTYEADGIHTDDEKENDAYEFAKKYKNDKTGFVSFICDSPFSVNGSFKESWKYIETGMKSIERFTNLCICVKEEVDLRGENSGGDGGRAQKPWG